MVTVIGVVFIVVGVLLRFMKHSSKYDCEITGKIVDSCYSYKGYNAYGNGYINVDSSRGAFEGYVYPVFEYIVNGTVYKTAHCVSFPILKVKKLMESCESVKILYEMNCPSNAILKDFSKNKFLSVVFLAVGLFFIVFNIIVGVV